MSRPLKVIAATGKSRDEKTFWTRIGSAWPAKNGEGYDVQLNVMPAPGENGWRFLIRPDDGDERAQQGGGGRSQRGSSGGGSHTDDDIPFAPVGDVG